MSFVFLSLVFPPSPKFHSTTVLSLDYILAIHFFLLSCSGYLSSISWARIHCNFYAKSLFWFAYETSDGNLFRFLPFPNHKFITHIFLSFLKTPRFPFFVNSFWFLTVREKIVFLLSHLLTPEFKSPISYFEALDSRVLFSID